MNESSYFRVKLKRIKFELNLLNVILNVILNAEINGTWLEVIQ